MKICVPVFAFLTGYFYAFCKTRTYRYSLRKITDLYVSYWFIYFVLLFAVAAGCLQFSLYIFAYEITALKTTLMVFCWYVVFYTCSMLLLPLLTRSQEHTPAKDILMLLILPAAVCSVLAQFEFKGILRSIITYIRDWFPCIASGYLCAKYTVFDKFFDRGIERLRFTVSKFAVWVIMIAAAMAGRYYCQYLYLGSLEIRGGVFPLMFTADIVYAPLFVYGFAKLLQFVKNTVILKILKNIGHYSLHLWFFHCIFFNACKGITQPILYWPRQPVLIVIWGLILCYIPSVLIDQLIKPVNKLKNRFL